MKCVALPMVLLGLGCCLLSANDLPPPQLTKAADSYYKELEVASTNYRKALAQVIATADKVEVYLIHVDSNPHGLSDAERFTPSILADSEFPVLCHGVKAKILNRKVLTPDEMKSLLPVLEATVAADDPGEGARCHDPAHAIRVWHGKDLIFQSSICFQCGNFCEELPDRSNFVGLTQLGFQEKMEALMPMPDSGAKDGAKDDPKKANSKKKN